MTIIYTIYRHSNHAVWTALAVRVLTDLVLYLMSRRSCHAIFGIISDVTQIMSCNLFTDWLGIKSDVTQIMSRNLVWYYICHADHVMQSFLLTVVWYYIWRHTIFGIIPDVMSRNLFSIRMDLDKLTLYERITNTRWESFYMT